MLKRILILASLCGLLIGCTQAAPVATPAAVSEAEPVTEPVESVEMGATIAPTVTVAPTETPLLSTATSTPLPTATATADPFLPVTVTPAADLTSSFEPYGSVEQPAYAESECSDKYPCNEDAAAWEARIQVPEGFEAVYFAHLQNESPTNLTFGPDGLLYVSTQGGKIYTVDGDGEAAVFFENLIAPTGLTFRPGTEQLYVSSRVLEDNANGEAQISVIENGEMTQIISGLPCCYAFMHGPHSIVFDSEGWGYVGVGAKADHGEVLGTNDQAELEPFEAGILRFSPDGQIVEKFAEGLRNPYGIAINSEDELFANDNGPDYGPPDEFHRIVPEGNHGYPWYKDGCDVCFEAPADVDPLPPTYEYPPHSAPTGLTVYLGEQFPDAYNNLFGVLWSAFPEAQRVVRFSPSGGEAETFATGFAAPIAAAVDGDGHLYVADWATGIIFRISYVGE